MDPGRKSLGVDGFLASGLLRALEPPLEALAHVAPVGETSLVRMRSPVQARSWAPFLTED